MRGGEWRGNEGWRIREWRRNEARRSMESEDELRMRVS